jgi:hypothetical protein
MRDNPVPEFLADVISNVTLRNGVLRVTFAQMDMENKPVPVARALIPANQFTPMLNGLVRAGRDIAAQVREKAEAAKKTGKKPAKEK